MSIETKALARRAAQALTAAAMAAGGAIVAAGPAYAALPLPTIAGVVVAGTTNKVVTAGTTIAISGM